MKKMLLLLGAVALTAAAVNVGAYNSTRSPRAADNQIKTFKNPSAPATAAVAAAPETVAATAAPAAPVVHITLSPRATENQIKVAAGTGTADRLAFTGCKLSGGPKAIAEAGRNARMSCCSMTLADCPMVATCGQ